MKSRKRSKNSSEEDSKKAEDALDNQSPMKKRRVCEEGGKIIAGKSDMSHLPLKKRAIASSEKENENNKNPKQGSISPEKSSPKPPRKLLHVLQKEQAKKKVLKTVMNTNTPTLKVSSIVEDSSSFSDSDNDIDDLFLTLKKKKYGFNGKNKKSPSTSSPVVSSGKKTPESSTKSKGKTKLKANTEKVLTPKEIDSSLNSSPTKSQEEYSYRTYMKDLDTKSPKDLILTFKRSPKKKIRDSSEDDSQEKTKKKTPKESVPVTTPKSSKRTPQKQKLAGISLDNIHVFEEDSSCSSPNDLISTFKRSPKKKVRESSEDDSQEKSKKKTPKESVPVTTPKSSKRTPQKQKLRGISLDNILEEDSSCSSPNDLISTFKSSPKKKIRDSSEDDSQEKTKKKTPKESVLVTTPKSSKKTPQKQKVAGISLDNILEEDSSCSSPRSSRFAGRMTRAAIEEKESLLSVEDTAVVKKKGRSPKQRSSLKSSQKHPPVTPTTERHSQTATPRTPLERARLSLHVSAVPDSLPCREKEFTNILRFLENKITDRVGGCMYISGVPGTGKTATVTQVIKQLQVAADEGRLPKFDYFELNGMRLSDPRQAYVQLWQKMFSKKEKIAAEQAQRKLDAWFSKPDRKKATVVLLVDELDLICTKKQDVVYNLLDWPTRAHSRLVVLTIANTMDMPERMLKGRVTSRMGLTRLTFLPYTHQQLEAIVLARLAGTDAFVPDAVRLVTRKVAAVSGDARRALDICRRATDLPAGDETVKICHIEQAVKEMTNSNMAQIIRSRSRLEQLFLRSMSDVSTRSGLDEVSFLSVLEQLTALCVLEGVPRPPLSELLCLSNRLRNCRLVFSSCALIDVMQRLTLNVTQDEIHYALTKH